MEFPFHIYFSLCLRDGGRVEEFDNFKCRQHYQQHEEEDFQWKSIFKKLANESRQAAVGLEALKITCMKLQLFIKQQQKNTVVVEIQPTVAEEQVEDTLLEQSSRSNCFKWIK